MPVVSVTRLRLRSWRFLPGFAAYAFQSNVQARRARGNRGLKTMREPGNIFWTATLWESEYAMKQFRGSGAHGRAMPKLLHWCDEASVARWDQDSDSLPTWQAAHQRMLAEGRPSKVLHPSAAHQRFEIPAPKAKD